MDESADLRSMDGLRELVLDMREVGTGVAKTVAILIKHIDAVIVNGKLDGDLEKDTGVFVNVLSSSVITNILQSKPGQKATIKGYQSVLDRYVRLFIALMTDTAYTVFLDSAKPIFASWKPFYKHTAPFVGFGLGSDQSPNYLENVKTLGTRATLDGFMAYVAAEETLNLKHIAVVLSVFRCAVTQFPKDVMYNAVLEVIGKLNVLATGEKEDELRNIDAKEVKNLVTALTAMTHDADTRAQIDAAEINLTVRLVKSGFINQQCGALATLKTMIIQKGGSANHILAKLREAGVIEFLMKDLHYQLVDDFTVVFKEMLRNGEAGIDDVKRFWEVTVGQHPGVIESFVKGWSTLVLVMTHNDMTALYQTIIMTNRFPSPVLFFLESTAFRAPISQRIAVFEAVSKLYFSDEEKDKKKIIDALVGILPTGACKFCDELQTRCMNMIERGENVEYALSMFKASFSRVESDKAVEYLNVILDTMVSGTIEAGPYLELLVKIMGRLSHRLSENQFRKLMSIIGPMAESDMGRLCRFLDQVISKRVSSGSLFRDKMRIRILREITTSRSCDLDSAKFILATCKYIEKIGPEEAGVAVDCLWNILQNAGCLHVVDYLMTLYEKTPGDFIKRCFVKIDNEAILMALLRFIHHVEDGLEMENVDICRHCIIDEEDTITVHLIGTTTYVIAVPKRICYAGFCRKVGETIGYDISCLKLTTCFGRLSASNFRLFGGGMEVDWCFGLSKVPYQVPFSKDHELAENEKLPSMILPEPAFSVPLFDLLTSNNMRLSKIALQIVEIVPTFAFEIERFTDFSVSMPDWRTLLDVQCPYMLIYRLVLIDNLVKRREVNWIESFMSSGGLGVLLDIVKNGEGSKIPMSGLLLLLTVTKSLVNVPELVLYVQEVYSTCQKELVASLIDWIINLGATRTNRMIEDRLICELLTMLESFVIRDHSLLKDNSDFVELLKYTLFYPNDNVRSVVERVVTILPAQYQPEMIRPLLPFAFNGKCGQFFMLLQRIIDATDDIDALYGDIFESLMRHFELPETDVLGKLMFRPPPPNYTNGIFSVLNSIVKKIEKIPEAERLFEFVTKSIIFNTTKFYEPTRSLFDLVVTLINREPSLAQSIIPLLRGMNESTDYVAADTESSLATTARSRGLRNLGATCYMNSTLQQLFGIRELRRAILHARFTEDDWGKEFQYVFAKLAFFPCSYFSPHCFVSKWTDWGGQFINPREQADAVEFLQMLLGRLEEKVKGITSIFYGTITHTLVARNNEMNPIESTEDFLILPLEVKGHTRVEDSLRTFLVPDSFESPNQYKVEGVGLVDADRYHKIRKAPEILIVQLKRFEYDLQNGTRKKLNSRYNFPMVLDLLPVMENNESTLYDLCGVVVHMGSAMAGHYLSHIKRDDMHWLTANDATISKCNSDAILEETAGGWSSMRSDTYVGSTSDRDCNAYILFYRKRNGDSIELGDDSELYATSHEVFVPTAPVSTDEAEDDDTIDPTVLERLVESIHQSITTKVVMSKCCTELLKTLAPMDADGTLIYSFFVKFTRSGLLKNARRLCNQCKEVNTSNAKFAEFVLQQTQDIDDILFNCDREKSAIFSDIFTSAISSVSQEALMMLIPLLQRHASNVVNDCSYLGALFDVIAAVVKAQGSSSHEEWLGILMNILTKLIPEYDEHHKIPGFYRDIGLGSAFSTISTIFQANSKCIAQFSNVFGNRELVYNWLVSKNNGCELIKLLTIVFAGNKELTNTYLSDLKENEAVTATQFAHLFTTALCIDDSMNRMRTQSFVKALIRKDRHSGNSMIFVKNVLEDMGRQAVPFQGSLTKRLLETDVIQPLFRAFLLSSSSSLRIAFEHLIYGFFAPLPDVPVLMNGDRSSVVALFHVLVDNRAAMESAVAKIDDMIRSDMIPTPTYFRLLKWTTVTGGLDKEAFTVAKEFIGAMKKFVDSGRHVATSDCFRFLYSASRCEQIESFVNRASFGKLLQSFGQSYLTGKWESVAMLIDMVPPIFIEDFMKSETFRCVSYRFFSDRQCGSKLRALILRSANSENVKSVATALWNERIFDTSVSSSTSTNYIVLTWKLLRRFPYLSNQFFKTERHVYLWALIKGHVSPKPANIRVVRQRTRLESLRPLTKVIAQFNMSYMIANKDKKFTFKGNRVDCLAKRWHDENVTISHIATVAMSALPNTEGANGLCRLIQSFIVMDARFCDDFFDFMKSQLDGFICRCPTDAQRSAAELMVTLNVLVSQRLPDVINCANQIIARELSSLCSREILSFDVIDKICERMQMLFVDLDAVGKQSVSDSLNTVYSRTRDVRMMSGSIRAIAFSSNTGAFTAWLSHSADLLSGIIASLPPERDELEAAGPRIRLLVDFMQILSDKHSLPIPPLSVSAEEVSSAASRFEQLEGIAYSDIASALIELISAYI